MVNTGLFCAFADTAAKSRKDKKIFFIMIILGMDETFAYKGTHF
jgi:hypothetical protein